MFGQASGLRTNLKKKQKSSQYVATTSTLKTFWMFFQLGVVPFPVNIWASPAHKETPQNGLLATS
jgi:hypothetical protein